MNKWVWNVLLPELLNQQKESGKGYIYISERQADLIRPEMRREEHGIGRGLSVSFSLYFGQGDEARRVSLHMKRGQKGPYGILSFGSSEAETEKFIEENRRKETERRREHLIKCRERHPEKFPTEVEKLKAELESYREMLEDDEIDGLSEDAEYDKRRIAELEYILNI